MAPYRGVTTRMSWPILAKALGKTPATSANPPVLENGATSGVQKSIFIFFVRRIGRTISEIAKDRQERREALSPSKVDLHLHRLEDIPLADNPNQPPLRGHGQAPLMGPDHRL